PPDNQDIGKDRGWRWRVFSIGAVIGLAFGLVYLGLPTVTGALLGEPITIREARTSTLTAQAVMPVTGLWAIGEGHAAARAQWAAAKAEERVLTVRETEVAQRRKSIDVMMAEKAAAEAKLVAEAEKIRSEVEAEAQRLINEAENVLTDPARASLFRRKMLEHVEGIVAASVKPLEKIQDIRIMQLDGVTGHGGDGPSGGSPTDEVINAALRYRVQAPLIDSLLADIGVEGGTLSKQGGLMREASDMQRVANEAAKREKPSGGSGGDGKPEGGEKK
ncbi:MAG: flotillin domain-containing protein, partial [Pseudomonadota bacterium]